MKSSLMIILFSFQIIGTCYSQNKTIAAPVNDTEGNKVNAHGAGILKHAGLYYLFGEIKKGTTWMVPEQGWECYRVPAGGVSCYVSKDLKNWEYKGVALPATTGDVNSDLDTGGVIERPKVIYNSTTKKFIMWFHADDKTYSYARCGIAISEKAEGPYQFVKSLQPFGKESRDMTLFKDDSGKAYIVFTTNGNKAVQIAQLSADYLSVDSSVNTSLIQQPREAPAMFKYKHRYYLITSAITGWLANAAAYATAEVPLGVWTTHGNPCKGKGADITFGAQGTFVFKLRKNRFLFMADRWSKSNLPASDYLWIPFKIKKGRIEIKNNQ